MGNSALWVLAWIDTTPLAGLAGAVGSHCPLGGAWREPAGPPPLPTPPFPPLQALPLALSWCDFQGRGAPSGGAALLCHPSCGFRICSRASEGSHCTCHTRQETVTPNSPPDTSLHLLPTLLPLRVSTTNSNPCSLSLLSPLQSLWLLSPYDTQ